MKRHIVKVPPVNSGWKEVELPQEIISKLTEEAIADHNTLMGDCIVRSRELLHRLDIQTTNHDIIRIATALFNVEATHIHYYLDEYGKLFVKK
jgi:hypothetical protein